MKPALFIAFLALCPALADQLLPATPSAYASVASGVPVTRSPVIAVPLAASLGPVSGPLTELVHPAWLCGG